MMVSRFTLILLLVAFLNALCFPLITLGLTHVSHMTFATLRAVLAGLALGVVAIMLRRPIPTDFRSWIALALIGLGATTSAYFGMFHAAEFVSPGLATVIANSQPLIAAALAFAFLSERLRPAQYVGLAIGFLGIVAVAVPQFDIKQGFDGVIGPAFIVLAAAGLAVSNVLMKGIRNRIDPLIAMSAQLLRVLIDRSGPSRNSLGVLAVVLGARSRSAQPGECIHPPDAGLRPAARYRVFRRAVRTLAGIRSGLDNDRPRDRGALWRILIGPKGTFKLIAAQTMTSRFAGQPRLPRSIDRDRVFGVADSGNARFCLCATCLEHGSRERR